MCLFRRKKTEPSETGIYIVDGKRLKPINNNKGKSIKDIAENLGYSYETIRTVHIHNSNNIQCIVFKKRTQIPLFILAKYSGIVPEYSDVKKAIKLIDWGFENRQMDFEDNNP